MLLPKSHLLPILQSNPIRQPVRVPRITPERAVFDLGDFEVYGLGTFGVGVLDDDADDAGGEEVADGLRGDDDAAPVGYGVLGDWGEGARHSCGSERALRR